MIPWWLITGYLIVGSIVGTMFCLLMLVVGNWATWGHVGQGLLLGIMGGIVVGLTWPLCLLMAAGGWLWERWKERKRRR